MRKATPVNWVLRALFLSLIVLVMLDIDAFIDHFSAHFLGSIHSRTITGEWHVVLLNILLFSAFLIPLHFRRRFDWRSSGIVIAFFISLFVEMYGISLTVLLASRFFGGRGPDNLDAVLSMRFLGVDFIFTLPMVLGTLLMMVGTVLVVLGWTTLYRGVRSRGLVTHGLYAVSRHPQYLGFLLVVAGWLIGWPTPLSVLFSIVLMVLYLRLCRREEREMADLGLDYASYMESTPFLI